MSEKGNPSEEVVPGPGPDEIWVGEPYIKVESEHLRILSEKQESGGLVIHVNGEPFPVDSA